MNKAVGHDISFASTVAVNCGSSLLHKWDQLRKSETDEKTSGASAPRRGEACQSWDVACRRFGNAQNYERRRDGVVLLRAEAMGHTTGVKRRDIPSMLSRPSTNADILAGQTEIQSKRLSK